MRRNGSSLTQGRDRWDFLGYSQRKCGCHIPGSVPSQVGITWNNGRQPSGTRMGSKVSSHPKPLQNSIPGAFPSSDNPLAGGPGAFVSPPGAGDVLAEEKPPNKAKTRQLIAF